MEDWSGIVAQHGEAVWRAAWRILGSEADAADCVQETFAAAVRLSRRQTVRSWPALLRRLATMQALGLLRQRRRLRRHVAAAAELPDAPDPAPGPSEQAQAGELAEALREALIKLPPTQAAAFSLRFFEGLSYEQVAEAMGVDVPAVGVLLHRARARLRRQMQDAHGMGESAGAP